MDSFESFFGGSRNDFSNQLSEQGIRWIFEHLHEVHTEIFNLTEPGVSMSSGSHAFALSLPEEFRRDPRLGIVFGEGAGHAFFRTQYLQDVLWKYRNTIKDAATLARAFRAEGYHIKKVRYVEFRGAEGQGETETKKLVRLVVMLLPLLAPLLMVGTFRYFGIWTMNAVGWSALILFFVLKRQLKKM